MSLLPARMKKIQFKKKALECSHDFSHYKSMGIFPDAQGQLTMQSMVGSSQISNSSKTLKLSLLPAKMKKIRSKMKALECSPHYTSYINFSDAQVQITLESVVVFSSNWNSSKLSCMSLLPTGIKMIHTKIKELEWSQHFPDYRSMGIFKTPKGS